MKRTRLTIGLFLLVAVLWSMAAPAIAQEGGDHQVFLPLMRTSTGDAPLEAAAKPEGTPGNGPASHIVVFRDDVDPDAAAQDLAQRFGLGREFVYRHALKGASFIVPPGREAAIRSDPRVAFIEPNLSMHIFEQTIPTGVQRIFADDNANITINGVDDYRIDVDVAVIDTGVDFQHPDLNVVGGVDCSGGSPFRSSCRSGGDDDHYHGTHVAGTIGASDNGIGPVGVAPGARIWSVKVLDGAGSGYTSWIVAGIDWVTANADTIEVANMSLGGAGVSSAYQVAIDNAVANGVVVVVAAGNSDADANNYSPAYVPSAITVSALADFDGAPGGNGSPTCRTDQDDTLADFSNWGSAIDIAAPGVCIYSTYPIEQGEYGTISGTSMAAPHVAGAAALLASGANKPQNSSDVTAIRNTLVNSGNLNWTDDSGDGIKERLLDVSDVSTFMVSTVAGSDGGSGGTPNNPPTASFTYSCTDLACTFDASGSSDDDGSIVEYVWTFGDGGTSSGETTSHTYAGGGSYTIELTVTDDDGDTGSQSQTVTVSTPSGGGISLTATSYKVRGLQKVDLTWSGATSGSVEVKRNGATVATIDANSGSHTDNIDQRGGDTYTYEVCEAGTSTCSDQVTVVFG